MDGILVGRSDVLKAGVYVFAPGPWLAEVFSFLASSMTPTRQDVFFFGPPAGDVRLSEDHLPTWIDGGKRPFFRVPGNHWRGFKIADDTRGAVINPSTMEREISQQKLSAAREYLRMRLPAMAEAPLLENRVCQYENSTDHNFILDRIPKRRTSGLSGAALGMVSSMAL
jgi:glycine/D-amino acid oxidase-like deaminating enzyme